MNDADFGLVKQNMDLPQEQRGVPMINPHGQFVYVPKQSAGLLLGQGYSGGESYENALKEGKYGGWSGTAAAAGAGAGSMVSLGLSDVLLSHIIGAENLKNLYDVNPGSTLAGEAVGAIAPVFGEAGSALKAGTKAIEAGSELTAKEAGAGAKALTSETAESIAAQNSLNAIDAAQSGGALSRDQINAGMTAANNYSKAAHDAIDSAKIDPTIKDYLKSAINKTPAGYITNMSEKLGQTFGEGVLNPVTSNMFLGSAFSAQTTLHDYAIGDPVTATDFVANALTGAAFGGVLGGVTHVGGKVFKGLFTNEKVGNVIEKDAIDKASGDVNLLSETKSSTYQDRQDNINKIMDKAQENPEFARFSVKAAEDKNFVEQMFKDPSKASSDLDSGYQIKKQLEDPEQVHPIFKPIEDARIGISDNSKAFEEASKKINYGTNFDLTANPELAKSLERGDEWKWKSKELDKISDIQPIKGQSYVLLDDIKKTIDHIDGRLDDNFQLIEDKELRELTAKQYSNSAVANKIKAEYKQYLTKISKAESSHEFYSALNKFRANLGTMIDKKASLGMQPHEVYSIGLLNKTYDSISNAMKDSTVWGQFGKQVSDLYDAKSSMIKAKKSFDKAFKVQGDVSASKVGTFIRGAGRNPINAQRLDILNNYANKLKTLEKAYNDNGIKVDFGADNLLNTVNNAIETAKKINGITRSTWYKGLSGASKVGLEKPSGIGQGIGKAIYQRVVGAPTEILMPHKWPLGILEFIKNVSHNVDFKSRIDSKMAWEKVNKDNFSDVLKAKIIFGKNLQEEQSKLTGLVNNSFNMIRKSSISHVTLRGMVSNYDEEYKKCSDLVKNHLESNVDVAYNKVKDLLPEKMVQDSVLKASDNLKYLTQKMPPELPNSKPLPQEKKDYVDTFNATMYPTETLKKILDGTATSKETQVFQERNPYLVQLVTQKLNEEATFRTVDYSTASKLALFNVQNNAMYSNNGLNTLQINAQNSGNNMQQQQQQQQQAQQYPVNPKVLTAFKPMNYNINQGRHTR